MHSLAVAAPLISCLFAGVAPPSPCDALVFYENLRTWLDATTSDSLAVTFDEPSWPVNQVLTGPWTVNGVTFIGLAGAPRPNIWVSNSASPFGTAQWLVANGDENIDITPATPTTALAFHATSNQFGPAFVKVYDTSNTLLGALTIPTNTARFVGITSGAPIAKVNFSSTSGAFADTGIDNVRVATYITTLSGDLDGDGDVDAADLAILLGQWGGNGSADLDCDGDVDAADLAILLGAWTG